MPGNAERPEPMPLRLARHARLAVVWIASAMNYAAGWAFIACALFITFDVIARRFFGFSSQATTEVSSYMLAFGMAWGLSHALTTRSHIRVDVLVNRAPLALRQYLHLFALTLFLAVTSFMAWAAWTLVDESVLFNARDTSALSVPLVIPQGLWMIGLIVLPITALILLVEVLLLVMAGRADTVETLMGPRGFREETEEALEATGLKQRTETRS